MIGFNQKRRDSYTLLRHARNFLQINIKLMSLDNLRETSYERFFQSLQIFEVESLINENKIAYQTMFSLFASSGEVMVTDMNTTGRFQNTHPAYSLMESDT